MNHKTDRKQIHKGAATNFLGFGLNLVVPLLMVLVAQQFGAKMLGDFLLLHAAITISIRVLLFGLDKGIMWWVAKDADLKQLGFVIHYGIFIGAIASAVALGVTVYCIQTAGGDVSMAQQLQIMLLGLVPALVIELIVSAIMGRKNMKPKVFIKDSMVPVSTILFALIAASWGYKSTGLSIGYVLANWIGLFASVLCLKKEFGLSVIVKGRLKPQKALVKYAFPLWIGEALNSFLQRLDILALAYFVKLGVFPDAAIIGVYGIVKQFSGVLRTIRGSFDPIVLAVTSTISVEKNPARLANSFSHASFLISSIQIPILVFLLVFIEPILAIYGTEFLIGADAVRILSLFWVINGILGLCGIVVLSSGHSYYSPINVLIVIVVEVIAFWFYIPKWGLNGLAFSVGLAYTVQGIAQLLEMKYLTSAWNLGFKNLVPFIWCIPALIAAFGCWHWLSGVDSFFLSKWQWWPKSLTKELLVLLISYFIFLMTYAGGLVLSFKKTDH